MEKQKREKNGVDGLIIFGRISRVGVAGVSEDGCQKISCKVSGNLLENFPKFPGNIPESWVCPGCSK